MKANAPEKLYITNDKKRFSDKCHSASIEKYVDDDIEYVRKDAFIDKAIEWISNNYYIPYATLEDFRNYMEG